MKGKKGLPINRILLGDAGEKLKNLPSNSIDLICCDPPYGYSFIGKDWDKALVSLDIWKECFRVLKDGAFAFVMSAPRQDVLSEAIARLRDAGFNIGFSSMFWAYASGFPKSLNISKSVDKQKGFLPKKSSWDGGGKKSYIFSHNKVYKEVKAVSEDAKALAGSYGGFQPKPAVEIVIVAMKPFSEKTFAAQALKNGKAITWLDDCRIPIAKGDEPHGGYGKEVIGFGPFDNKGGVKWKESPAAHLGRFPANLLVSDETLNHGTTNKSDSYFSRYFDLDKWAVEKGVKDTFPFLICPKPGPGERNKGCEGLERKKVDEQGSGYHSDWQQKPSRNFHPTVKPTKLMSYLITLGSRPGDVVLDPFVGSGTTCIAAKMLNRNYIGIEKEKEYYQIAIKRLKSVSKIKQERK
ncbi:MAG: DNA methyltransferase [Candidatus Omnitrophota bacterium]|nr:DNA methyltransferase [Candidatus Omnitrophota bacterium]